MKYRLDINGQRYYVTKQDGKLITAPSVTTVIDGLFSQDDFVRIKKREMGESEFEKWWDELADKGTALHNVLENMIDCKMNNLQFTINFNEFFKNFLINEKYRERFTKDVLCIDKFVNENLNNVSSVETEKMFIYKYNDVFTGREIYYGGAIDLLIKDNNGVYDVYDLKSGHYSEMTFKHKLQLSAYSIYVHNTLGTVKSVKLLCPKEWRKEPNYNIFDLDNFIDYGRLFTSCLSLNYEKYDLTKKYKYVVNDDLQFEKISWFDYLDKNFDNLFGIM